MTSSIDTDESIATDDVALALDDIARVLLRDRSDGVRFDVQELPALVSIDEDAVPIRLVPGRAYVGPIRSDSDSDSPCAQCFDRRWQELRGADEQQGFERGSTWQSIPSSGRRLTPAALASVRLVVDRAVLLDEPGAVWEVDLEDLSIRKLSVVPHSACTTCSRIPVDTSSRVYQGPTPRVKRTPADLRSRHLSEIELPESALVNDVCGTLSAHTFAVYQCTATLPVSGFFRVRSRFTYHDMWWSGQSTSRGSSTTSGLLEGLERHAGQYPRARRTDVFGSRAQLGAQARDPRLFGEYSDDFYASHDGSYQRFDDDMEMPWVWGYSFGEDAPVLVPEQLAYYLDRSPAKKFVQECSSGCASGSTLDEAVFNGLLELIERDSFLLTWFAASAAPEIDPASCDDEEIQYVIDRVERLGYRVRFFDLRVDLLVPSVLAIAERLDGGLGTLCLAAASSFDPLEAVRGALSEIASYVPGLDERVEARHDELSTMTNDWPRVTELTHHALLYGLPEMRSTMDFLLSTGAAPVDLRALHADWEAVRPSTLDFADDLAFLVDLVRGGGGDVVVVDQTTPEQLPTGIRTAAVLADGLIPIDFGWQRQRVVGHRRLADHLAGRLPDVNAGIRPQHTKRLNVAPHPFP